MNPGIRIFKIHKIQHFLTICEKLVFEISRLRELNHLVTETNDLTHKAPITTAADDIHKYFFIVFQRK